MADLPKPRPERLDTPELAALRRLRVEAPELATAVDLQIEIAVLLRRLQGRLSTPWTAQDAAGVSERLSHGIPLLRLDDVAFDWVELRVLFRQMADLLARFDLIEPADRSLLLTLNRDGRPSADDVRVWFDARVGRTGAPHPLGEAFAQTLELCVRPFIERAAESIRSRVSVAEWARAYCPMCGADPEMASIPPDGTRRLHCGGCATSWPFDEDTCPACLDADPRQRLTYAGRDGRYRLVGCGACRRYIKTADARRLERQVIVSVDAIATLPLDAAAAQKGFSS